MDKNIIINNNNNNNEEENLNYILYKKIFNNKFLSNYINNFIYKLNDDYIKQYCSDNHYPKPLNKYFLKDVPYSSVFQTNNIYLFRDKIKSKTTATATDGTKKENDIVNLCKFLKKNKERITIDEIKDFYHLNKEYYFKSLDSPESTVIESIVNHNLVSLFSIVYQDQYEIFFSYKSIFNSLKRKSKKVSLIGEANSKFFVYSNRILIMNSFLRSSLEMVKFLYEQLEIDIFQLAYDDILLWAIISDNRLDLVPYLIKDLDYFKNQSIYSTRSKTESNLFSEDFYNYLFLIDHKSFKKIIKFYPNHTHNYTINKKCYKLIQEHTNNNLIFDHQINCILNLLYHYNKIVSKPTLSESPSDSISNIIKHLIDYNNKYQNNNNDENNTAIENIKQLYNLNQNNKNNKKKKEKRSLFKSFLSSSTSSSSSSNNEKNNSLDEFSKLNFDNFNLEREVKRIYIFLFLNKKLRSNSTFDKIWFSKTLVYFASKFQEFRIIEKFLKEINNNNSDQNSDAITKVIQYEIYKNIFIYGNGALYLFAKSLKLDIHLQVSFCLLNNSNIKDFINLLLLLNDHDDNLFGSLFFVVTSYIETKELADQIIEILQKHYIKKNITSGNYKLLDSRYLENNSTTHYFYKNYESLFTNWDLRYK
ncbi:hypothetical protein DICPUDRAFT_84687 [Dictyostelium purpureum]|uniref:Uncharacterized protein n=1 Tax=Dictyostelium purpureum TaxID=5786 RepID=F1A3F2_DICPU|nr:uncharacterized protein DICPUDRAFT_84687 [Dictyostelium purpureum]EGC29274.1 hypothetical protein DICPUDRAFT_84687 [Dictyostelium purpureum]|eukprot:XP_003294196.1 hypothetical protein DICPUDRAFT_84687 [Dictyostelium purpureum]